MKLLVKGWTLIPHSYAIVNCFQLIHLYKNFKNKLDIYIEEESYFDSHWNKSKKLVYTSEYNHIINNFKKWNGEKIDIIYNITYPYNITCYNIPVCVFYTSEFSFLDQNYFCFYKNNKKHSFQSDQNVFNYINSHPQLYFTSPSLWSSKGMHKYNVPPLKNKIITHGVDVNLFKLYTDTSTRKRIREFYKIKDSDILFINIGAMTQNKGILLILQCMIYLVYTCKKTNFKLLLKGTSDLYASKSFLQSYFQTLKNNKIITNQQETEILTNYIIFTDNTLSYTRINDLFNAADVYISPYLAEGFNLTVLESLASGLPVIVPQTGSTSDYINNISSIEPSFIYQIKSSIHTFDDNKKQNIIHLSDLTNLILENENLINQMKILRYKNYNKLITYITKNYSWNVVSHQLFDYFTFILS